MWPTSPSTQTFPLTVTKLRIRSATPCTVTESPGAIGTAGASPSLNWSAPTAITTRARPPEPREAGGSTRWIVTRACYAVGSKPPAYWMRSRRVSLGRSS